MHLWNRLFLLLSVFVLSAGLVGPAVGADWFVAPSGSPTGNGTKDNPWDIETALRHPAAVQPGDNIWLRGGTYSGVFLSELTGTAAQPIVVRGEEVPASVYRVTAEKMELTLWYSRDDEWLALESVAKGGRIIRYELT